jgi:hypothetical protein
MVTRTRLNGTLYVQCRSCLIAVWYKEIQSECVLYTLCLVCIGTSFWGTKGSWFALVRRFQRPREVGLHWYVVLRDQGKLVCIGTSFWETKGSWFALVRRFERPREVQVIREHGVQEDICTQREDMTWSWRNCPYKRLHNLYSSP